MTVRCPAFDDVEPGDTARDEVHVEPGVASKPATYFVVFVGAVVVGDQVNVEALGSLLVDLSQKADPFLMPVTGHAIGDDLPFQHLDGSEQSCGPVSLVVVQRPRLIGRPGCVRSNA